jgi:hypothetical protein
VTSVSPLPSVLLTKTTKSADLLPCTSKVCGRGDKVLETMEEVERKVLVAHKKN